MSVRDYFVLYKSVFTSVAGGVNKTSSSFRTLESGIGGKDLLGIIIKRKDLFQVQKDSFLAFANSR